MTNPGWPPHNQQVLQPTLATPRLRLEPIDEKHAEQLFTLFADPELHRYVPSEPLTMEQQRAKCARWAKRRSPDGRELWLNWAARYLHTCEIVGHFQAGVTRELVASIGYLVARKVQKHGIAVEGMTAVLRYLNDQLGVKEVKAWTDSRNLASHQLAARLGLAEVERIKNADYFKGQTSDEIVFALRF